MGPVKCGFISGFRIFPIHRKQYRLEAVRHLDAQQKMLLLYSISSTRSILGMAREYEFYISFHPNPVCFFSVPSTICFGILSAEFSPTLIGGDSKAKFILGHGARKLHPLGPWSGLVQGCHNVFFYKGY